MVGEVGKAQLKSDQGLWELTTMVGGKTEGHANEPEGGDQLLFQGKEEAGGRKSLPHGSRKKKKGEQQG